MVSAVGNDSNFVPERSVFTITGGTGSFGQAMTSYLLRQGAAEVRIISRDEAKQDAMRTHFQDERLRFFLGDTRDDLSLRSAIEGSDYLFHAAALKQVPSAEFFPLEAVNTNILGSANVLRVSVQVGVKSVVCLSTDKAVYPINAMGMSKALMEKTASAIARQSISSDTTISATRYGNVMFSRGSVIPKFVDQILSGGPVTITDPNMTRFMMSLDESVDLVEHAFKYAEPGDLFVRKAPAATIGNLVSALSQILAPKGKIDVITMGFRHGEKLHESLLSSEERALAKSEDRFFKLPADKRDLNYSLFFEEGDPSRKPFDSYSSNNTHQLAGDELVEFLLNTAEMKRMLIK